MDNKGTATMEIVIILIFILLIMGILLTFQEKSTEKIIAQEENENFELLINEFVDNLINNPGNPDNWFEIEKGIPGLAIINDEGNIIPNSVSWEKFCILGKNYKKLVNENVFNSKIKTSIELIPQKSSISSVKIGSTDESNIIYSVNRLIKCDFYKKYVIKDFQNEGKCNRNHNQEENSCNYFKIFKGNIKKSDYYLLIDDSEKYNLKYIVDTTRVVKQRDWQTAISNCIYLNDKINFYDDTSAVVFIHLNKQKAKALLISVPKDFNKNNLNIDYFRTNECELILKAGY